MEKPIFELITEDNHYKIYDDGIVMFETKNKEVISKCLVINRIPQLLAEQKN